MKKIVGLLSVVVMIAMAGYSFFYSGKHHEALGTKTALTTASTKKANEDQKKTTSKKSSSTKKEQQAADLPKADPKSWNLALVGPKNKIQNELNEADLTLLPDNSHQIAQKIVKNYEAFSEAATKAGYPLVIISAFRSVASQQEVFDNNVYAVMSSEGLDESAAIKKTKETITEPGYSEHHTGLALDVVDENWYNNYPTQVLDAAYGKEPGAKWIAENAPKYGFIIRYPDGKEKTTGITYEPWHIRYVGKKNAEYITKHDLTLEEYLKELAK